MASLPEGFCPTSMQELANAIAERLIVSPNQAFTSFAASSVEPSSNVGPWLKDCLEWFVFDDATAKYIPIPKGFNDMQYFTTAGPGNFVVPDDIYKLKIHAWGAGGGGSSNSAGSPGSGGGGGAYGLSIITVTPGQNLSYTIGTGGSTGTAGGDTVISGLSAGGGQGASSNTSSGIGGTAAGFGVNMNGQSGMANSGGSTNDGGQAGGDAGGWGGKGGTVIANVPSDASKVGTTPGGGGSGGSTAVGSTGGAGASGGILIEY